MPNTPTGRADRLLPALRRAVLVRETADRTDGQLLTAFLADRDADAFAVLVRRHGPMVLGVCRRVVGDSHTADDAFQAVFLVLARRANAIRPREQVGNWLYGVAFRTAIKARTVLARRRSREKQVEAMPEPPAKPPTDPWSDLQPVIDEELARLPDKLRLPVVLCDLEGRPQRAVAKHLGVAPATLATRLASARRLLAGRLSRRGVTLSGGALAVVLGERASAAMVAPKLADATVRAAEAVAAGAGASGLTGLVSAHAVHLSEGVMRMMLLSKLKTIGATALAALALTGGLGFGLLPAHAGDEPAPAAKARPGSAHPSPGRKHGAAPLSDAEFLRRICLDLTGNLPNPVEVRYFTADPDANKRHKVVDWMLADDAVKTHLAKKLNVPAERIRVVRLIEKTTGKVYRLAVVVDPKPAALHTIYRRAAFAPDGQTLHAEIATFNNSTLPVNEASLGPLLFSTAVNGNQGLTGSIVLNERNFDAVQGKPARVNVNGGPWTLGLDVGQPNPPGVTVGAVDNDGWLELYDAGQPSGGERPRLYTVWASQPLAKDSDAEFLRRVTLSARGSAPTALEERYFAGDKDPKKREKLLDLMLKDPAVARKVGEDWKKKMLEPPPAQESRTWPHELRYSTVRPQYFTVPQQSPPLLFTPQGNLYWSAPLAADRLELNVTQPDKFEKLVADLFAAQKSDEQVLEGITLAAVGRLPTPEEKRATLAVIGTAQDKKAAYVKLAKALAATEEGKKHAPANPPKPANPKGPAPVPPAKK